MSQEDRSGMSFVRTTGRLATVCALCALTTSCAEKPMDRGDQGSSLVVRHAEFQSARELSEGQFCVAMPDSPIRITLVRINQEQQAAQFDIEDTQAHTKRSGWISKGDFATFAPEEVGTMGLQVVDIKGGKAVVRLRWGQ